MAATTLRREESLGLALALVAHAGLIGWLMWQRAPAPVVLPERMTVTISEDTGPVSTAPQIQPEEAAPDKGPVIGEAPPPPVPLAKPEPAPPQPITRSALPLPTRPATKSPPVQAAHLPTKTATNGGATAFDNAFSNGVPRTAANGKAKTPTATQASAQQKSSWSSLIGGRVASRLNGCGVTGLDIEKLYIDVRFTLATDGSIQSIDDAPVQGTTPANQAQAKPFKACAMRAIKLAAPFAGLPPEFYDIWKVRNLRLRLREHSS
jgi:hypothetical protein